MKCTRTHLVFKDWSAITRLLVGQTDYIGFGIFGSSTRMVVTRLFNTNIDLILGAWMAFWYSSQLVAYNRLLNPDSRQLLDEWGSTPANPSRALT